MFINVNSTFVTIRYREFTNVCTKGPFGFANVTTRHGLTVEPIGVTKSQRYFKMYAQQPNMLAVVNVQNPPTPTVDRTYGHTRLSNCAQLGVLAVLGFSCISFPNKFL